MATWTGKQSCKAKSRSCRRRGSWTESVNGKETRRVKRWRGLPGLPSRVEVEGDSSGAADACELIDEPE
jgi:hypothetical protein